MYNGELSVGFVCAIAAALDDLGIDAQPLLKRFDLPPAKLASAGAQLSIPRYMRLGHAAIELSGRNDLGLLMGQHSRLQYLGLAGACAALAPDLRSALRTLTQFEPLYARNYLGQSNLQEHQDGAWINFYSIAPYNGYNRFVVDAVLKGWHAHMQQITNQPVPIDCVQIEYPEPPHAAIFEKMFACPVEFSAPANRLHCSPATLAMVNPQHCQHSWNELQEMCQQQLTRRQAPSNLSERVVRLLAPQLRLGEPKLKDIAKQLRLPVWTLQRQLEQEGQHFRQLLQNTRHSLAASYLRDTRLSTAEIAWQLGFSSSEAFQRAFKRWQGQTPGHFRRQITNTEAKHSSSP